MRNWIWRNFQVCLPDDWEMLQFSKNDAQGGCLFADRYGFRFEFNWRKTPGEPDLKRILSDYMGKLKEENKITNERFISATGWRGIEGRIDGVLTTRFGSFFPGESCLIEAVFLWPGTHEQALEKNILENILESPPRDGFSAWKAFGMEIHTDEDLSLDLCEIKPALAKMAFHSKKNRRIEEKFERFGMVEQWFKKPIGTWLREQLPAKTTVGQPRTYTRSGHHIETVTGHRFLSLNDRVFRKKIHVLASAWICPSDSRLYHVCLSNPAEPKPGIIPAGPRLRCCREI